MKLKVYFLNNTLKIINEEVKRGKFNQANQIYEINLIKFIILT